jgi:hypothetical protein
VINSFHDRLNILINLQGHNAHYRMKFEVKTEPVCAVLVAVPAYFAIVVVTLGTGVQAQDSWFPITVIVTILAIAISFIYSK